MLVDIVSKNGNLLLNVVLRPDGTLDPEVETMLHQLADWTAVNGEAIYGTRPWLVYGEGSVKAKGGAFKEDFKYSAKDIRFTTKGATLYAIALGWPEDNKSDHPRRSRRRMTRRKTKLKKSNCLATGELKFTQTTEGLTVELPEEKLSDLTCALRITGSNLKPATAPVARRYQIIIPCVTPSFLRAVPAPGSGRGVARPCRNNCCRSQAENLAANRLRPTQRCCAGSKPRDLRRRSASEHHQPQSRSG